jgi:hypothetical protein
MRKFIPLLLFALYAGLAHSQSCSPSLASVDIFGNNIKARIQGGGELFTTFSDAAFQPNPVTESSPSTIYTAGLWIGAVDGGGNQKLAAMGYRSSGSADFSPGPLNTDGTTTGDNCSLWDRLFLIKGTEVADFLANPPANAAELRSQFPTIAGWPSRGNPHFQAVLGYSLPDANLAPFFDADDSGTYDPMNGDYPFVKVQGQAGFVPTEFVFCVYNDQKGGGPHTSSGGQPLQIEVQQMVWAFDFAGSKAIKNTIFTSHRIINKSVEHLDSCYVGIWADLDLGCYADDYAGCDTTRGTFYAYNTDALDGSAGTTCTGGGATFGSNPPVQSVTYLNKRMDKFAAIGSQPIPTFPVNASGYYSMLTGSWPDGSSWTDAQTGYGPGNPVNYLFPSEPANANGWSMCTAGLASADQKVISSHKVGKFLVGQVEEINMAWTVHPNPSHPCDLGTMKSDVDDIKAYYDLGFTTLGTQNLLPHSALHVQPNPANTALQVAYENLNVQHIALFDAAGRLVLEKTSPAAESETLDVQLLPEGVYTLRTQGTTGVATKKVVILR